MTSATQVYSFPAQLGRRGNTALVVVGLHVVLALGLIAGTALHPPKPKTDAPPPITFVPAIPDPPPASRDFTRQDNGYRRPEVPIPVPPDNVQGPSREDAIDAPPSGPAPGAADRTGVPVSSVRVLKSEQPVYTAAMIRAGEHGSVVVRVLVGANGRPGTIEVATSSGFARLDAAAVAAVRHWMFAPAQTESGAIASWVQFRVTFRLVD